MCSNFIIPAASQHIVDVQIEWYISSLPSNIAIFVDRANKATLVENMKEALSVQRRILALEKRSQIDDRKTKKVTFKDDSKKKTSKDPFDLEGLQKMLKTMSNEMVEIKKQVAESSAPKRPFRTFKKNSSYASQPPNTISNVESDQESAEDSPNDEEVRTEEEIELNGMWDLFSQQKRRNKKCQ